MNSPPNFGLNSISNDLNYPKYSFDLGANHQIQESFIENEALNHLQKTLYSSQNKSSMFYAHSGREEAEEQIFSEVLIGKAKDEQEKDAQNAAISYWNIIKSQIMEPKSRKILIHNTKEEATPKILPSNIDDEEEEEKKSTDELHRNLIKDIPFELEGCKPVRILGKGGQGLVYLARHPDGQLRAIKLFDKKTQGQVICREASIYSVLEDFNPIFSFDVFETKQWYGMVLKAGEATLWDHICYMHEKSINLSVDQVLWIYQELYSSYYRFFQRGLCHRDIKPQNIVFTTDPKTSSVKVVFIDFGLTESLYLIHQLQSIAGTPGFVDPELLKKERSARNRTDFILADLFAIGIVILMLFNPNFRPVSQNKLLDKVTIEFEQLKVTKRAGRLINLLELLLFPQRKHIINEARLNKHINKLSSGNFGKEPNSEAFKTEYQKFMKDLYSKEFDGIQNEDLSQITKLNKVKEINLKDVHNLKDLLKHYGESYTHEALIGYVEDRVKDLLQKSEEEHSLGVLLFDLLDHDFNNNSIDTSNPLAFSTLAIYWWVHQNKQGKWKELFQRGIHKARNNLERALLMNNYITLTTIETDYVNKNVMMEFEETYELLRPYVKKGFCHNFNWLARIAYLSEKMISPKDYLPGTEPKRGVYIKSLRIGAQSGVITLIRNFHISDDPASELTIFANYCTYIANYISELFKTEQKLFVIGRVQELVSYFMLQNRQTQDITFPGGLAFLAYYLKFQDILSSLKEVDFSSNVLQSLIRESKMVQGRREDLSRMFSDGNESKCFDEINKYKLFLTALIGFTILLHQTEPVSGDQINQIELLRAKAESAINVMDFDKSIQVKVFSFKSDSMPQIRLSFINILQNYPNAVLNTDESSQSEILTSIKPVCFFYNLVKHSSEKCTFLSLALDRISIMLNAHTLSSRGKDLYQKLKILEGTSIVLHLINLEAITKDGISLLKNLATSTISDLKLWFQFSPGMQLDITELLTISIISRASLRHLTLRIIGCHSFQQNAAGLQPAFSELKSLQTLKIELRRCPSVCRDFLAELLGSICALPSLFKVELLLEACAAVSHQDIEFIKTTLEHRACRPEFYIDFHPLKLCKG